MLELAVNGSRWSGDVPQRLTLADFLREHLRLTGTHLGCEQGVCGACTVLVDGKAIRSCLMLAVQASGSGVTTVEGLDNTALQAEFLARGALQCGFCTPGFLMTAEAILRDERQVGDAELRDLLGGNICRCTGYEPIVEAVRACLR